MAGLSNLWGHHAHTHTIGIYGEANDNDDNNTLLSGELCNDSLAYDEELLL